MKENVVKAFQTLGFTLEKKDDSLYCFTYEEMSMMLSLDEEYKIMSIHIPCVMERSDAEDELAFYNIINELNSRKAFVKAIDVNGTLWLSYDRDMFNISQEDLQRTITRMILCLESTMSFFLDMYTEINNGKDILEIQELDDNALDDTSDYDIIDNDES